MWYISEKYRLRMLQKDDYLETLAILTISSYDDQDLSMLQNIANLTQLTDSIPNHTNNFILGICDVHFTLLGVLGIITNKEDAELFFHIMPSHVKLEILKKTLFWLIDYAFATLQFTTLKIKSTKHSEQFRKLIQRLGFIKDSNIYATNTILAEADYILHEHQWLMDKDIQQHSAKRNIQEEEIYLRNVVIPFFSPMVNAPIYSTIIDRKHEIVMCSNQSARSVGLENWQSALGLSYKLYANIALLENHFKKYYNAKTAKLIHSYAHQIFRIQQYVFKHAQSVSFIDCLPYKKEFNSYLVTFSPIFDKNEKVVALQSIATEYNWFNTQDIFTEANSIKSADSQQILHLSTRELEVLFLLGLGITQEEIGAALGLKRNTIASIIRKQLCSKFNISGSNSKLLNNIALTGGYMKVIPESLWRPILIILEQKIMHWVTNRI